MTPAERVARCRVVLDDTKRDAEARLRVTVEYNWSSEWFANRDTLVESYFARMSPDLVLRLVGQARAVLDRHNAGGYEPFDRADGMVSIQQACRACFRETDCGSIEWPCPDLLGVLDVWVPEMLDPPV